MAASVPRTAASAVRRQALQACRLPQYAARSFTTTTARTNDASSQSSNQERPRWSYTPEGMKAPFSPHITKNPARKVWSVNDDPVKLDQFYVRFLGRDGDKMLPEEVKWLAVTHKSFDYGRRGFNDRLAFLGRQAIILETVQHIMTQNPAAGAQVADELGREAFEHPSLSKVDNFNAVQPSAALAREKVEKLALQTGLDAVLRWKPRMPENLAGSGQQVVLNSAVHAIMGAISLQHGAKVASKMIRERILAKVDLM